MVARYFFECHAVSFGGCVVLILRVHLNEYHTYGVEGLFILSEVSWFGVERKGIVQILFINPKRSSFIFTGVRNVWDLFFNIKLLLIVFLIIQY